MFSTLYKRILERYKFNYIGLDAGYKNVAIAKEILDSNKIPLMPYTSPKSKSTRDFEYNKFYDSFTCKTRNILKYTSTNRQATGNICEIKIYV